MRFGLGLDLTSAEAAPSGDEPPTLTFSTGLTRVANTITANLSTGIAGSQSVVGGTAASETLTLSSTAHATKGKILFGTAAYDEVNNYLGIGTVSPSSKIDITTNSLGTTQANTSGLSLVNETAAAAGAQQISPALRFRGYGWKTNATAASQSVDFRAHVLPVEGSSAPSGNLVFSSSINGGAYSDIMRISSAGVLALPLGGLSLLVSGSGISYYGAGIFFNDSGRDIDINCAGASGKLRLVGTPSIEASVTDYVNHTIMSTLTASVNSQVINGQRVNNTLGFSSFTGVTYNNIRMSTGFAPTSGTHTYTGLLLDATINQTGGANGVTRGIYVNPTLTSAADFRAIEVAAGTINVSKTITAPATTGDQTINKLAGTVNIAAAGTTVTVTNSLVTANSIIMCTIQTNDTTAVIKNAIPAAGSFVINLNTAATAETAVSFFIIN